MVEKKLLNNKKLLKKKIVEKKVLKGQKFVGKKGFVLREGNTIKKKKLKKNWKTNFGRKIWNKFLAKHLGIFFGKKTRKMVKKLEKLEKQKKNFWNHKKLKKWKI